MKIEILVRTALLTLLMPNIAFAQATLDTVSNQLEALDSTGANSSSSSELLDQLRNSQSVAPNQIAETGQSYAPTQSFTQPGPPNVWGNATDGINQTIDPNRVIDPITGRISGAVGEVRGSINDGINRALNGALSPIDGAIDRTLGSVNGAIDRGIASVMAPVDKAISGVVEGIGRQIDSFLDGMFGQTEEAVGGVISDATGGLLDGLLGGGGSRTEVEQAYDPLSQIPSIITATSFNDSLRRVTSPYADAIPFKPGGIGLPDYETITPIVDRLVAGHNGSPNRIMQGADRFSVNPQGLSMSLSNEIERLGSRAIANGTLSALGQEMMKVDLDGAAKTLDTTIKIADDAQDKDVTQDVMKNLSAQLAQDSVIRAGQYRQNMLDRQQQAANSVVTGQIAELLEEQSRARRADLLGNALAMHDATSQLYLPGGASPDDNINDAPITFSTGRFR